MPRLKSANNALTTLAAGIDDAATTFTVVDTSSFPVAPFMVTVGNEIMEVGAIDTGTNTFSSVSRGQEGTTAAAHSAGDPVENRFTAGTHGELADQSALDNLNNTVNQHLNDTTTYSTYKLNLDANGIFTEIQFKRADGTLILKSVLSSGTSPEYTTRTETEYEQDGTTVKATRVYTITYTDGKVTSEVLQ